MKRAQTPEAIADRALKLVTADKPEPKGRQNPDIMIDRNFECCGQGLVEQDLRGRLRPDCSQALIATACQCASLFSLDFALRGI